VMSEHENKTVEQLADKWVFECPKYSGYPAHVKTFIAGYNSRNEEFEKLKSELSETQDNLKHACIARDENFYLAEQLNKERASLQDKCAAFEEALNFYANKKSMWGNEDADITKLSNGFNKVEHGKTARQVLERFKC
jgi:hypothetical protein